MNMIASVKAEFNKLQKQVTNDNFKLELLRAVIKEYATKEYPGNERLNMIIMECIRKNQGEASFRHLCECIEEHQITLPHNKLSLLLHQNPQIEYDRAKKTWKLTVPK